MRQTKGMVSIQEDVTPEGCAECLLEQGIAALTAARCKD